MSFNLHTALEYFTNLDIHNLDSRVNHLTDSMWLSLRSGEPVIHYRSYVTKPVLRLYVLDNISNIKITYIPASNVLNISSLYPSSSLSISDIGTINSEETLFQRSLIEDVGAVEYGDIVALRKLYDDVVVLSKTLLKKV